VYSPSVVVLEPITGGHQTAVDTASTTDRHYAICCARSVRNEQIHSSATLLMPKVSCSRCNSRSWSTQSKAADRSSRHSSVTCHVSAAISTSDHTHSIVFLLSASFCMLTDDVEVDRSQ